MLYCLVFCTRYLDLFFNFHSLYLWVMKLLFIAVSFSIAYIMLYVSPYNKTYSAMEDNFKVEYLIGGCALMALLWNEAYTFFEILWAFSYWLEAVAIFPQLIVVHRMAKKTGGFVETLTSHYVFTLGGYRVMYLFNWILRLATEKSYWHPLVWTAGFIQTALFSDFFYYYIIA
jgi:ER lumen protein retaining receptor